jgi:hypothetical protein
MWRRTRWILLVLLVLLVAGAAAVALVEQPKLDDDRKAADARWVALRAPLDQRYAALGAALTAFANGGGGDRAVARDLGDALSRWTKARQAKDAGDEVAAANAVEAEATRLLVNAQGARFASDTALGQALQAFDATVPTGTTVAAYNRAVQRYQDERDSLFGAPIARVLGFDERPTLVLGG